MRKSMQVEGSCEKRRCHNDNNCIINNDNNNIERVLEAASIVLAHRIGSEGLVYCLDAHEHTHKRLARDLLHLGKRKDTLAERYTYLYLCDPMRFTSLANMPKDSSAVVSAKTEVFVVRDRLEELGSSVSSSRRHKINSNLALTCESAKDKVCLSLT